MTSTSVSLPFRTVFLPLAMSFVENSSAGFGYPSSAGSRLLLAAEELFLFYAHQADDDTMAEITIEDRVYKLTMKFSFINRNPDFRSLNMTWKPQQDEESLGLLGPMLAARSVSGLYLDFAENGRIIITAEIFREYTEKECIRAVQFDPSGFRVKVPSADDAGYFVRVLNSDKNIILPFFLKNSAMASDIVACGEVSALFAEKSGQIAGGVFWGKLSGSLAEIYGPYVICEDKSITECLMNELISRESRCETTGLMRRQGAMDGYEKYFDLLGEISLHGGGKQTYYYRQMQEDYGSSVYCGAGLSGFLTDQYDKLALLRSVREKEIATDTLRNSSVLMASIEHAEGIAVLRVLCAGKDMGHNLDAHTDALVSQGIKDILMEINTAKNEDIIFAEQLFDHGFVPLLLIPDGKHGDVAVFKYSGASSE